MDRRTFLGLGWARWHLGLRLPGAGLRRANRGCERGLRHRYWLHGTRPVELHYRRGWGAGWPRDARSRRGTAYCWRRSRAHWGDGHLPHGNCTWSKEACYAADFTLNGNGELTGIGLIRQRGLFGCPNSFHQYFERGQRL